MDTVEYDSSCQRQPNHVFMITVKSGNAILDLPTLHYINKDRPPTYHIYEKNDSYYAICPVSNEEKGYTWVDVISGRETKMSLLLGEAIEKSKNRRFDIF